MSIEYELIHKMQLNLSSMQRLRQVEEKNNHLKIKIAEVDDIRYMMVQERELMGSAGFVV